MKHYVIVQTPGGAGKLYLTTFNEWSPRQRDAVRMAKGVAKKALPVFCRYRAAPIRIVRLRAKKRA